MMPKCNFISISCWVSQSNSSHNIQSFKFPTAKHRLFYMDDAIILMKTHVFSFFIFNVLEFAFCAGLYSCHASNSEGAGNSNVVSLVVQCKFFPMKTWPEKSSEEKELNTRWWVVTMKCLSNTSPSQLNILQCFRSRPLDLDFQTLSLSNFQ